MYSFTRTILYVSLIGPSIAFQFPFKLPFLKSSQTIVAEEQVGNTTPRIAIIGAGAAGSSAAFWISKAKERSEIDVEVDVYEREPYVGGRECYVQPVRCQLIDVSVILREHNCLPPWRSYLCTNRARCIDIRRPEQEFDEGVKGIQPHSQRLWRRIFGHGDMGW